MDDLLPKRYLIFEDLPNHIKVAIDRLQPGDCDAFVRKSFPELHDRSIIESLNAEDEDAESKILELIQRLRSMFG